MAFKTGDKYERYSVSKYLPHFWIYEERIIIDVNENKNTITYEILSNNFEIDSEIKRVSLKEWNEWCKLARKI